MTNGGDVPTITTRSSLFCFRLGACLDTIQLAALMGSDLNTLDLGSFTEAWVRQRIGLCVHIASYGVAIMGALAMPMSAVLGRG